MIVITAATGKLGRLVIQDLLQSIAPSQIVAAVRNPAKAQDLASLGIQVREADYARPATLAAALTGADKLLFISSSEIDGRAAQHEAVVQAAQTARVSLLAYTSILAADTSPLELARDHKATEALIRGSGLPYVFLRNGWYLENHTEALAPALAHGEILGAAGNGRFASAARADYAGAAAAVLTTEGYQNKMYELAGDAAYTLSELAAEVSRQSGKPVAYHNLTQSEYEAALIGFHLPPLLARVVADADACAAKGELDSTSHDLANLLGRPTTPLAQAVAHALQP